MYFEYLLIALLGQCFSTFLLQWNLWRSLTELHAFIRWVYARWKVQDFWGMISLSRDMDLGALSPKADDKKDKIW